MKVGELLITMASDIARVKKDMDEVQKHTKRTADVAESAALLFKRVFAGLTVGYLAREFVQIADSMVLMNARLKLATTTAEEYSQAQADIYRISQKMGVPLRDNATLYARLADPIRKLGGGTKEVAGITEAFSAALRISGATTAEASSATIQFSQAMASGVLRGEEFNSVNEAAPRIMQALEAALGKTRGELRKMAEQGQLTADVVGNALLGQLDSLRRESQSMPTTVGMAFQQLTNELYLFVGRLNESTGATNALASSLQATAESVSWLSRSVSNDSSAISQAMQRAEMSGGGLFKQWNDALGMIIGRAVGLQHVARDFMTWEQAVLDATEALRTLEEQEQKGIQLSFSQRVERANARQDIALYQGLIDESTRAQRAINDALKAGVISASENNAEMAKLGRQNASLSGQTNTASESFARLMQVQKAATEEAKKSEEVARARAAAEKKASEALQEKAKQEEEARRVAQEAARARFDSIDATLKESEAIAEQVRQLEEETLKMGMSRDELRNLERARLDEAIATARQRLEIAIANGIRGEELDGITLTVEELERLRDAKEAGWAKEAAIQARDAAHDTSSEWAKTVQSIENGLTDSLMRAFESGKGFMDAFKDTLVNAFKTMVLEPTIRAIIAPVAGGLGALFGSGGAAAGQGGGGGNPLSALTGGTTGSLQNMVLNAGDYLATSSNNMLASGGEFLQGNYQAIGQLGSAVGAYMVGNSLRQAISGGYEISSGMTAFQKIGTAVGGYINPVLGAVIGAGAGVANRLFGRKLKDSGIEGTLSTAGITGNAYEFYKGGLFRSNKTKRSDLDPNVAAVFDAGLAAATAQVSAFVDVLGLPVQALRGYSEQIKISFKDLSEEEIKQAIADSITKFQAGLASLYSGAIAQYQRAGETTLETLQRLAQLEGFSRVLNEFGGVFSTISTLGIDARESLIAMAGGMDALLGKTQQFVADYYTQQEQAALSARGIFEALSSTGLNLAGLRTKEQYRALLESQNLTTDQGQAQFTALLNASAAFAQLAPYLAETGNTLYSLAQLAPAMKELETLFAPGTQADGTASGLELGLSDVSSAVTTSGDSVVAAIEQLRADLNNGLAVVAGNTGESSRWLRDLYENPGGA